MRQETGDSFNTHFDPKSTQIKETLLQLYPIFQNIMFFMQRIDDSISITLEKNLNSWTGGKEQNWTFCKETVSNATADIDRFVRIEIESPSLEKKDLDLHLLLGQLEELALATS
jgi:hypothetical protein